MVHTVRTGGSSATPNDRGVPLTVGSQVDWKQAERRVQHWRCRIFRAAQEPRWKQVRNLTQRLLRSDATRRHCRSIGLSGMRGNSHVPFLGEEAMVTPPPYPTVRSCVTPAFGSG